MEEDEGQESDLEVKEPRQLWQEPSLYGLGHAGATTALKCSQLGREKLHSHHLTDTATSGEAPVEAEGERNQSTGEANSPTGQAQTEGS